MVTFLQGATSALALVAALFFVKFWRDTRDAFFLLFALAFVVDALVRVGTVFIVAEEQAPAVYTGRLISAALIIAAILRKNRGRR